MRRLKSAGGAVDKWGRPVKDEPACRQDFATFARESSGAGEWHSWTDVGNTPGCRRSHGTRPASPTPNGSDVQSPSGHLPKAPKQPSQAAERSPRLGGFVFRVVSGEW
jgi:hypothetical protein